MNTEHDTAKAPPASATSHPPAASDTSTEVVDRSAIIADDGRTLATWSLRFILVVAALVVAGIIIKYTWVILLPVIMAIIVSTALWPSTRFLRRRHFPHALAAICSILGFAIIFFGIFAAMAPVIRSQGPHIVRQATDGINQISAWLSTNPFGLDVKQFNLDELLQDGINFLRNQSQNIITGVSAGVSAATSFAVATVVTLIICFFMLKDGDRFLPLVRSYTGTRAGWHLSEVLTRSWNTVGGFIRTQALVSFIDALFIGIGLWVLGVPLAPVLAVITFFGGFIPIVGAFSAGALSVVIALVINGPLNAALVLLLVIAVQQLEGHILSPILQSKAMNLHATVVLLAVTLGSTLFGIVGAFLAVPVVAVLAVWLRYHSEMVALRAGEITVDDIEIATAKGQAMEAREAFTAVREHLKAMATRAPQGREKESSSTAQSALATQGRSDEK